jgi:hypothetical protein
MSYSIPTSEPDEVFAGDLWSWKITLDDYRPADGWSLIYYLTKTGTLVTATSTNDGAGAHLISIGTSVTAPLTAGELSYIGAVAKGSERYTVRQGVLRVRPNYATGTAGLEDRAYVRQVLEALEAAIIGRASQDQMSYQIAGRSISFLSPIERAEWRDRLKTELRRLEDAERLSKGLGTRNKVRVRFG